MNICDTCKKKLICLDRDFHALQEGADEDEDFEFCEDYEPDTK